MRCLAIVLVLAASAATGQSDHARDLVQGHVDKIATCRAALREIDRQSAQRLAELADWRAFYAGAATEAVNNFIKIWKDHNKKRLDQLRQQWSTARKLGRQMKDWAAVPHFNGRMFHLKQSIDKANQAMTDLETGLRNKTTELHIAFVGKITDIAVKIGGIDTETKSIREKLSKGEYRIHYPKLGEVWRTQLQGWIGQEEKTKRGLLDLIAKGEYKVLVPGIGWRTRNKLEAEIDYVTKEIEKARETLKKGEWIIARPLFDWKRQRELEAIVKDQREWVERQRKWRTEPLLKVLIPGAHAWLAAIDVDKKIANTKKGIQGVQRKVADGAYAVAVDLFGSMDRKAIEKQLAALQEQLANTSLSKQAREKANAKVDALKKGLKDITTLSGLDLIIRALDLTWWTKVLGAFVSLAKPQLRGRELELSQHEAHLGEYRRELNTVVQMHERHLLRLKRGLGYIP